jgi:hypothetical protein
MAHPLAVVAGVPIFFAACHLPPRLDPQSRRGNEPLSVAKIRLGRKIGQTLKSG